ncbi:CarD family transcriptional regulator [bacterium]|nr:CarD family transcriptional regulator [candidate division CSSED10-310 bacterium]
MFKVGDLLIYPTQGLAEVQGIESKVINGTKSDFYILRIMSKNLAIMVPIANEKRIGLRHIIRPEDLPKVRKILSQKSNTHYSQWHHRYSDNFEKLKSGSIFQTAEVVRDLVALKSKKNLAIKETRMMDNAKQLLVAEIASAKQISEKEATEWIDAALEDKAYELTH